MARRKGSGRMSRGLGHKTKSGQTKRRRVVKLDTKGLRSFQHILGKNGVTFKLGLFNAKAATKGARLEFGTDRQVPRPWLSSTLSKNGKTLDQILKLMPELVSEAIKGNNAKNKVAKKMVPILQMHLMQQRFKAGPLKASTIRQKLAKGASNPHLIGIDTFHMATHLDVRATGGKTERKKK